MAKSLTILYTAQIRGDLALLPRLHTFLAGLMADNEREGTLLLDLGASCSDASWHCRATGGRSSLLALDAMGYHAANVEGQLKPAQRRQLAGQVTLGLVDAAHDWRWQAGNALATLTPRERYAGWQICLRAGEQTELTGATLRLANVPKGQVGLARLAWGDGLELVGATVCEMPSRTPPNPSIAGTVEFIESEARRVTPDRSSKGSIRSA